jgi:hypothetical protein
MNLLLEQERKALQAKNKLKMKKKVRKHATLRNDLFLSIQEGYGRIQQLNKQVNEQVNKTIPKPHQRAPPHCSGYWTTGHTIQSCLSKLLNIQILDN